MAIFCARRDSLANQDRQVPRMRASMSADQGDGRCMETLAEPLTPTNGTAGLIIPIGLATDLEPPYGIEP